MAPADAAIPALLRAARGVYAEAVADRLAQADFADLPSNGALVLAGVARYGESLGALVQDMAVSRQAVSQLIDSLVLRGYLVRRPHPDDRRRMLIEPTARGRRAAGVIRSAVTAIDDELAARVSARDLVGFRRALTALGEIKDEGRDEPRSPR
jgi:DNA-binding MarR family transcriptional regulator